MNPQTVERFWHKVNKTPTCWLWTASKRSKGYGAFVWADESGKIIQGRAHRFAYELLIGPIPEGRCVLHRCDVPNCVKPEHLYLGTKADNNRDMIRKGRHVAGGTYGRDGYARGEKHHNAKLTEASVRAIRDEKAVSSYTQLSRKYGIAIGHLHRIVTGKAWQHVI